MAWFDSGSNDGSGGYSSAPNLSLLNSRGMPASDAPNYVPSSSGGGGNGLLFASMGLSALGAIGSAVSQSRALKAQGDIQSTIAGVNAKIAGVQAGQALEAGDLAASRTNLETRGRTGTLKARAGASGVEVNSGSNALTSIGSDFAGKIDELRIRNNAARTAWGYTTQGIQDTYEGQFAKLTASSESQQTLLNGGLQAIGGPLSIYAKNLYYQRWLGGGGGNSLRPYAGVN